MGIFRFLLAALVVLFHFGGLGWIVGRIAVFAFYGISGFLIFQVLDRVYLSEPRGIPRFFCNRFVRLVPLYLVYTVLTLAMVRGLGPQSIVDPAGRRILQGMIEATSNCSTRVPHSVPTSRWWARCPSCSSLPLSFHRDGRSVWKARSICSRRSWS